MKTQAQKARAFAALHEKDECFIIPNPYDAGTARILANLGFEALATTGAGLAFSRGRRDGAANKSLDEILENAREIIAAVDLPLSADLENGHAEDLDGVAETYRLAAGAGLVGASIEDATGDPGRPVYDFDFAVDRVHAAVAAARENPFPFVLTARAENFLYGRPDLGDTIRRLQAFQEAGADVLYAPGLRSLKDIETVVRSVDRPLNVVMGLVGLEATVAELSAIGVKRVSLGSTLSRAAFGAFLNAARELKEKGSFDFARDAAPYAEINDMF